MDIHPIDIFSSDSENEHTEKGMSLPMGLITSSAARLLPSWAPSSTPNPKSSDGKSHGQAQWVSENGNKTQQRDGKYMENNHMINFSDSSTDSRQQPRSLMNEMPSETSGSRNSNGKVGARKETTLGPETVNWSNDYLKAQPEEVSEQDLDGIGNQRGDLMNHHRHFQIFADPLPCVRKPSSQHTVTRMLPSSLQPTMASVSKASMENGGDNKTHVFHGNYPSRGLNAADHKLNMKGDLNKENGDEVIICESVGTRRLLPPSLMHGKSVTNQQPAGLSDPAHQFGVGEERPMEHDERLIYQAALQDLAQPKLEATLPDGLLAVSLLRHQRIALAWMLQKETASLHCLGGILADDQGLGKTISVIALVQMQRYLESKSTSNNVSCITTEALNLDEDDDNNFDVEKLKQESGFKMIPVSTTSLATQNGRPAAETLNLDEDDNNIFELEKVEQESGLKMMHETTMSLASKKGRPAAGTLVVCPASVLRQWARELDEKVGHDAKLSILVYHGSMRTKDPVELAKYDVVVTTYSIVTNEVPKQPLADDDDGGQKNRDKYALSSDFSTNKKRKKTSNTGKRGKKNRKDIDGSSLDYDDGPLARVHWSRVVLDEAQTIKNHRTQVARACCGLRAKRRWCLSGTPIQNAIDDLYSYFRFLRYDPYAIYKSFCSAIKYPIARDASTGYKKLQAVLKTVMLRRTKDTVIDGEPIIQLPSKSICLKKIDFSPEERAFYTMLEADSRQQFKAYAAAGTVKQNYANILLMLLRLRQACDSPLLVKEYHSNPVGKASLEMARRLPGEMLINLLNLLEASLAICAVCNDPPEDAVVTMCGHVFCYQCVSEYLTGDDHLCPAYGCRVQLVTDLVFSRATLVSCISDEHGRNGMRSPGGAEEFTAAQNLSESSKITAVLGILHSLCKLETELPQKAIIFSQWTSMLDLLESSLNKSCIQYRRLDGKMTLAARDRAVKDFAADSEVTVMIMSLKAGNLGLNMVAACHVILMDLWWNPSTEDQAVDRAHRIGQTRPVTVSRLTIKDTVEDRILALQEEKRKMVSSAFGEDPTGNIATRLTVEDLRDSDADSETILDSLTY